MKTIELMRLTVQRDDERDLVVFSLQLGEAMVSKAVTVEEIHLAKYRISRFIAELMVKSIRGSNEDLTVGVAGLISDYLTHQAKLLR